MWMRVAIRVKSLTWSRPPGSPTVHAELTEWVDKFVSTYLFGVLAGANY